MPVFSGIAASPFTWLLLLDQSQFAINLLPQMSSQPIYSITLIASKVFHFYRNSYKQIRHILTLND